MQVEALSVTLRPRLGVEAADLGVALVQLHARTVWRVFTPVFLVFLALCCATVDIAPWLPALLIFWCKPWLDCCLLFVLGRAVFGQPTRAADLWRQRASVWGGQWLRSLLWRRFSLWRTFTQPAFQLEGQRGPALRQRCRLLRQGQGARFTLGLAFLSVQIAFALGMIAAVYLFTPPSSQFDVLKWLFNDMEGYWVLLPTCCYGLIVFILEPFYVAAGLAMYLNRRVELEAWDIEQEFRRAFA